MDDQARFAFGANWQRLAVTTERIDGAVDSLRDLFTESLQGRSFVDIGCGSGLFSLAAAMLGARVHSFDFDPLCVECARRLKNSRSPESKWTIEQGSILDAEYVTRLGIFDVVYSWGVLHHTGDLRAACANSAMLVSTDGYLVIAIYNDQGWRSRYWKLIKKQYCARPWLRPLVIAAHLPMLAARAVSRAMRRQLYLKRGMSLWRDYLDWLGGYPFEVATRTRIETLFTGFELIRFRPASSGCNEFVFVRRHTVA